MARARLTIPDMTCGHCQQAVTRALQALDGVDRVRVDLAEKQVELHFDEGRIGLEAISKSLTEEDYPPAEAQRLD